MVRHSWLRLYRRQDDVEDIQHGVQFDEAHDHDVE